MQALLSRLMENRRRSENIKIAEQLRQSEYKNESLEYVYDMIVNKKGA